MQPIQEEPVNNFDTIEINVWSNGTYISTEEMNSEDLYSMGDDYITIEVPAEYSDEQVATIAAKYVDFPHINN